MTDADFLIIGAGMAGVSLASELAGHARVVLIERETRGAYHATGRSAAIFTPNYGNTTVRALSRASGAFFNTPESGFSEVPLCMPRPTMFIAGPDQLETLENMAGVPEIAASTRLLSGAECADYVPILRADRTSAGLFDEGSFDLDVDAIYQGYIRRGRRMGVAIVSDCRDLSLTWTGEHWQVSASVGAWTVQTIVNAAGAWADEVASLAGVSRLGLSPLRRTVVTVDPPPNVDCDGWPMVVDVDERFYFKPEAGRLLLSPADETLSEPTDAAADEWDVAVAVDRVEQATTLQVRRIQSRWAGLRTFAPDRSPVAGFDPEVPGFFWLAAQGGYGIQMAPALARFAAALALRRPLPSDVVDEGVTKEALCPSRFKMT